MSASIQVSRAKAGSADAVKAVSVVSTGTVEIHPELPAHDPTAARRLLES